MRRILVLITFLCASASPARAAEPLENLYSCSAIVADAARLACYDAAIGRLKSAEQSGDVTVVDAAKVKDLQRESFGFALPSLPKLLLPHFGGGKNADLKDLSAQVDHVTLTGDGKAIVFLDNKQIWRQIDDVNPSWIKPGRPVILKRGALGSFFLTAQHGSVASVRVHRDE
jgi:hypothetical protein